MLDRREFISAITAAAVARPVATEPPRGAIYFPTRAFNAYQFWSEYSPETTARDLGYATRLKLNALRLWLSYEFWLRDAAALKRAFDDLLQAAAQRSIRVMPALFEGVGVAPTSEALVEKDPQRAFAILSPSNVVSNDPVQWKKPLEYVEWFAGHYASDARLLAIEVHNEPHTPARQRFARSMFTQMAKRRGTVALTVGGMNVRQSMLFLDLGLDVLQTHMNFPPSEQEARKTIREEILDIEPVLNRPVWLTEWQRLRTAGSGWNNQPLAPGEWQPGFATIAALVREAKVGNFFWSLMVKPAYLPAQRRNGTVNGVFHEDGAVWSLADARAISGEPAFQAEERPRLQAR